MQNQQKIQRLIKEAMQAISYHDRMLLFCASCSQLSDGDLKALFPEFREEQRELIKDRTMKKYKNLIGDLSAQMSWDSPSE